MSRRTHGSGRQTPPPARWETIRGVTERIDADRIKVTVEARTAGPRSQLVGATTIVDDQVPDDYHRKMRRLVRFLEERYVV